MLASFVHFLSCLSLFSFFLYMYFQVVLYAHDCSCMLTIIVIRNNYLASLHMYVHDGTGKVIDVYIYSY